MRHSKFIQLVLDMRNAQKNYFRNRGNKAEAKTYLENALWLEAEVDQALLSIDHQCNFNNDIQPTPLKKYEQPTDQHSTTGEAAPEKTSSL